MLIKELMILHESEERSVLTVMGQQPEKLDGDFSCSGNQLTSLKGGPQKVGRDFYCYRNKLTSLEGCPQKVDGDFYCSNNQLTSLEGGPREVGGDFYCHNNKLTGLISLPQKVGKDFDCSNNELTNLKDIHKHIKFIGNKANFQDNPIKSHVVGLLLIDGLEKISMNNREVETIINRHLSNGRDVLTCIDELEEAGYSEFAKI